MTPTRIVVSAAAVLGAAFTLAGPVFADEAPLPKLGPDAVSVTEDYAFLRTAPAPDYWAFAPFVKPQFTTSACSIAAVTAAVNGLRGLPANSEDTVTTQPEMLELVARADWSALSAEGGDGVKFDQLAEFTQAAVTVAGLEGATVETFKPADNSAASLDAVRQMLAANEESASDALLLYFNQGVVTGDWDGPHVSLIGAYDAAQDRVLILEVDQEWCPTGRRRLSCLRRCSSPPLPNMARLRAKPADLCISRADPRHEAAKPRPKRFRAGFGLAQNAFQMGAFPVWPANLRREAVPRATCKG